MNLRSENVPLKLSEAINLINPRLHEKYSPNLYRYYKRHTNGHRVYRDQVWRDPDGTLWLGIVDEGCFIGVRLMHVLCDPRVRPGSYRVSQLGELTCEEDFWHSYVTIGRCAIDPDHSEHFLNAKNRFVFSNSQDRRVCQWCGSTQVLHRWMEKIERQKWVVEESVF